MAEHAYFELPEMQRGILPDAGGIQRLPRRIPYNVAMEMMLSGRRMSAGEAVHWGLAYKAVPGERLMSEAMALVRELSTDESPPFVNGVLGNIQRNKSTLA